MLQAKKLRHKPINWQLVKGSYTNEHLFQSAIAAIEEHLEMLG